MNQIQFVVEAIRWFDKTAGNTYHACMITRTEDGAVLRCPFQYGYGNAYQQTAFEAMANDDEAPERK